MLALNTEYLGRRHLAGNTDVLVYSLILIITSVYSFPFLVYHSTKVPRMLSLQMLRSEYTVSVIPKFRSHLDEIKSK